jgi:hypothetical protein
LCMKPHGLPDLVLNWCLKFRNDVSGTLRHPSKESQDGTPPTHTV